VIEMIKEIRIPMDESEHKRLSEIKDKKGKTWRDMLFKGAEHL